MILRRKNDIPWSQLCEIGKKWQLLNFIRSSPESWEDYWIYEREYWDADSEDKSRLQLYFGKENTERNFLNKTKKRYEEYVIYLSLWKGLCRVGEIVKVILLEKNVIALSKDWRGKVSDHSDLEIWLKEEKFLFKHLGYCCDVYNFGTIYVPHNSLEELMGERPGKWGVSHKKGTDIEVIIKENENLKLIKIGDAIFRILD